MTSRTSSVSPSAAPVNFEPHNDTSQPARKFWFDPASLPNYGDISHIQGNVSAHVKQLALNTFMAYGAGDEQCFGHHIAKAIRFVDISAHSSKEKHGRMEVVTTVEVVVNKGMLNGMGLIHGGCLAFLIDICCNSPLAVLGLIQSVNSIGITQAMNVVFHSPVPLGSCLQIISTSVAMGGRVMSARCEILNKGTGSVVASAYLNVMQPSHSKL